MKNLETCPNCDQPIHTSQRITLVWVGVMLALVPSLLILLLLYYIMTTQPAQGKSGAYLIIGSVGLVGYIFKFVKKERFKVETCTRCNFKKTTKLNDDNSVVI